MALWNPTTGARLGPGRTPTDQQTTGHGSEVNSVAWRPDGIIIATGSYDQRVLLWAVQLQ
jgi:WD40 repeat protein